MLTLKRQGHSCNYSYLCMSNKSCFFRVQLCPNTCPLIILNNLNWLFSQTLLVFGAVCQVANNRFFFHEIILNQKSYPNSTFFIISLYSIQSPLLPKNCQNRLSSGNCISRKKRPKWKKIINQTANFCRKMTRWQAHFASWIFLSHWFWKYNKLKNFEVCDRWCFREFRKISSASEK